MVAMNPSSPEALGKSRQETAARGETGGGNYSHRGER